MHISCDQTHNNQKNDLSKKDKIDIDYYYESLRREKATMDQNKKLENILNLQYEENKKQEPTILDKKTISLSITQDIDIKNVFIEIARLANLDIELSKSIVGGMILHVKDKPLREVIEMIASNMNLRYELKNNILIVKPDIAYIEHYHLDFINIVRKVDTGVSVEVSLDGKSTDGMHKTSSGSSTSITNNAQNDIWSYIEVDLSAIVYQKSSYYYDASGSAVTDNFISSNRQANTITIKASSKIHADVRKYLKRVTRDMTAQVLIEAKLVEVSLQEEYKSGVDWDLISSQINVRLNDTTGLGSSSNLESNTAYFSRIIKETASDDTTTNKVTAMINALNLFGTTKVLSSPRIHAINNQHAILSFAKNQVYYTLDISSSGTSDLSNISSDKNTVPIGVILNIHPTINLDTNEIVMSVRPTISRIVDTVQDPSAAYLLSQIDDKNVSFDAYVPVIEVKEIDSIMKIKSGDVMIIGGLMEERSDNIETGIPGFQSIPVVGKLFKSQGKKNSLIQTIIFIKATIIPGSSYSDDDKRLYERHFNEPNSLFEKK